MSVLLLLCTTVLLTGLPLVVQLDFGQWLVLACVTLIGYAGSYLYFDTYIDVVKTEERLNHKD